jgi:hypothetical protein
MVATCEWNSKANAAIKAIEASVVTVQLTLNSAVNCFTTNLTQQTATI